MIRHGPGKISSVTRGFGLDILKKSCLASVPLDLDIFSSKQNN
jgi:hypothetical protein